MANTLEWLVAEYFANNHEEISLQAKKLPAHAG
jgi:hypothetical protein